MAQEQHLAHLQLDYVHQSHPDEAAEQLLFGTRLMVKMKYIKVT